MIYQRTIGIILPAYNESGLISKTLSSVPDYIDVIVPVNDGSTDDTHKEMIAFAKKDPRITVINLTKNLGIGGAIKAGLTNIFSKKIDYVVLAAGDNQCDLNLIKQFIKICEAGNFHVCRGNRFLDKDMLENMPHHRRFGNIIYSFIIKFVSGYYSLFDFLSTYGAYRTDILKKIDLKYIRNDYMYDQSVYINLNIVNARIKEIPAPSIYAEEVSNINYISFVFKSIPYMFQALLHRIYQKYILNMNPIGLFYFSGLSMFLFGLAFGIYVALSSIGPPTASTATVMLSIVPFILGFQLLLQAIVLDIQNEPK